MNPIETRSTVLLKHHLKALKLPAFQTECEKVAARCATENVGWAMLGVAVNILDRVVNSTWIFIPTSAAR
jgi:hypothetical protein